MAFGSLVVSIRSCDHAGKAVVQAERQADEGKRQADEAKRQADQEKRQADTAIETLNREFKRANDEDRKRQILEWQQFIVYKIIDKYSHAESPAVGFDDIQSHYLEEAQKVTTFELPKEQLQTVELERVLLDLLGQGIIYKTHDAKYISQRSELLVGFGRTNPQAQAKLNMVYRLSIDRDKFTDDSLQSVILAEFQLTPQEYRYILTDLMRDGWIVRDEASGMLRTASTPPKAKPSSSNN